MPPGSLQRVTDAFKAQGGRIRVTGYAEPANGADTSGAIAAYQAALAHAEAVKSMLVAKGIPAARVTTQAATRAGAGDTADIQQEP
jgi:outer membrane protein OmpA-like peptidoglycan-associated protein